MVSTITYPDLLARDAFIMGVIQAFAVVFPDAVGRTFPYALLTLAVAYLLLAPRFYWRPSPEERPRTGDRIDADASGEGKR
jgi:CDP-diacylglycerol--serine O-phosphatidyltransferase